jgi:hypothetical protein
MSVGTMVFLLTRGASRSMHIGYGEGFLMVALGWVASGLTGALPS